LKLDIQKQEATKHALVEHILECGAEYEERLIQVREFEKTQ
jgi:hypothetical protein